MGLLQHVSIRIKGVAVRRVRRLRKRLRVAVTRGRQRWRRYCGEGTGSKLAHEMDTTSSIEFRQAIRGSKKGALALADPVSVAFQTRLLLLLLSQIELHCRHALLVQARPYCNGEGLLSTYAKLRLVGTHMNEEGPSAALLERTRSSSSLLS